MNLFEVSPTLHWTPTSSEVRSVATIKTDKHTYELIVRCNKSIPDHLKGWLDKVVDRQKDVDRGRFVELTCKENRETFDGVESTFDSVVDGVKKQTSDQRLKYVYLFSTTPHRREVFEKLSAKIAKKLEWQVYQDKNYFIIYNQNKLNLHQPD